MIAGLMPYEYWRTCCIHSVHHQQLRDRVAVVPSSCWLSSKHWKMPSNTSSTEQMTTKQNQWSVGDFFATLPESALTSLHGFFSTHQAGKLDRHSTVTIFSWRRCTNSVELIFPDPQWFWAYKYVPVLVEQTINGHNDLLVKYIHILESVSTSS